MTVTIQTLDGATPIFNHQGLLQRIEQLQYTTLYPGGLYGACSFFIPQTISQVQLWSGGETLRVYDGQRMVWEGFIEDLTDDFQAGRTGTKITALGPWGAILQRRTLNRWYADDRISTDIWTTNEALTAFERATDDRQSRIQITPKNEAWGSSAANDTYGINYATPTNETIKRTVMDHDFDEDVQTWTFKLRDVTNTSDIWSVTATGAGSHNNTLGTVSSLISIQLYSGASQTPNSDGSIYGRATSIMIYASRNDNTNIGNAFNVYELVYDIQGEYNGTDLSADTDLIDSTITQALEPFYTRGAELHADILMRAIAVGDASNNPLAVGLRRSQLASDDLPKFFLETQPVLTDYDYILSASDAQTSFRRDVSAVRNYIVVNYIDDEGARQTRTPDDNASLKDDTSITTYGQRDEVLNIGEAGQTFADDYGIRFLTKHKDPTYSVTKPIQVTGWIQNKEGNRTAASQIEAGKRLKIANYLNDLSGTGLTFLITGTNYNHDRRTCSISVGVPDDLGVLLAKQRAGLI